MNVEASFDWFGFISQIIAVIVGGVIVIVTNEWSERRRQKSAYEDFREHERAVYTGVFTIRNFISEQLNALEESGPSQRDLLALEVAQRNLHTLIEKSRPKGQTLLLVIYDLSLRLDHLLVTMRCNLNGENTESASIGGRLNALIKALDQFDLVTSASLDLMSEEELEELMSHSR